jgi:hypothetical protein
MIELNLTYEESKKILSLGYDFRRASNVFVNEQGRIYNRANNYLAVARDITLYEIDKRPDLIPAFFRFIDHLTPFIPKAALQQCLPHTWMFPIGTEENHMDWVIYQGSEYVGLRFWASKCKDGHITSHQPEERFRFMSVYEAFLWAHDHYPKELRYKFNSHRLDLL